MKTISLIILFISSSIIAQSRAEYYPLQVGNKWVYKTTFYEVGPTPSISFYSKEVIGDTTLDNGIKYFVILENGYKHYERFDTLTNEISYYSNAGSQAKDVPIYSLNYIKDSTVIWNSSDHMTYKISFNQQTSSDTSYIYLNGDGLIEVSISFKKYVGIDYQNIFEISSSTSTLIGSRINGKEWGQLTGVNINRNIVSDYKLEQNYPNPFNPTTTIVYEIPVYSHVKITIYNSLGEMIRVLQDKYVSPGIRKLNFNAGSLASGVYYYQLITEGKVLTKKLLLIK
jgi:hypothetical protein